MKKGIILCKKDLEHLFGHCFKWVRVHFLTNAKLEEWKVEFKEFRKYKSFPPDLNARILEELKKYKHLINNKYLDLK